MIPKPTIAIIGAGTVGATTAYTLIVQQITSRIILVDSNDIKCKGEVQDLSDTFNLYQTHTITLGTLQDAAQADIAIITAGIPQKPGQSRIDLLETNSKIISTIIQGMKPINPKLIIIMVTNPVDILTYLCQTISDLPRSQVFGSGTLLDTWRLRTTLSNLLAVSPQSVDVTILGEHGDSQFVAWSSATVSGKPLLEFDDLKNRCENLALDAKNKAYSIIQCKGSTAFGIASCIAYYCQNIIGDTKKIIPVSCFFKEFNVYMSLPAVIGSKGVEQIIIPPLNSEEKIKLKATTQTLARYQELLTNNLSFKS